MESDTNTPTNTTLELPEIFNTPLPPTFDIPESYNQLNTILNYYNLPTIQATDSFEEKIEKINLIVNNDYLKNTNIELVEITDKIRKIADFRKMEEECDNKEIELANMKIGISQKYGNKTIEELLKILNQLKSREELNKKYENYLETIKGIKSLNKNDIKELSYIKEETFGAYAKQRVLDKLQGRDQEWARVLFKIVKENVCKVEKIRQELEIDRVNLLRIIYNYCAKGILEYDRLEDSVRIKMN